MIVQDSLLEIFLFNPCNNIFILLDNKKLALSLCAKSSSITYLEWSQDYSCNSRINLMKIALIDGNSRLFYSLYHSVNKRNREKLAYIAAKNNMVEVVNFLIGDDLCCWDKIAKGAAYCDNIDLIKEMSERDSFGLEWKEITYNAAKCNSLNVLRWLDNKIDKFSMAKGAAKGYNLHLLDGINRDNPDVRRGIVIGAARGGDLKLFREFKEFRTNYWRDIILAAAKGGHKNILHTIDKDYREDYELELCLSAIRHSDIVIPIVKSYMNKEKKAKIAIAAAKAGNCDIILHLVKLGYNNYEKIITLAAENGHKELLNLATRLRIEDDYAKFCID